MRFDSALLFGKVDFGEDEDYFQFRYRFLFAILLAGILANGAFLLADLSAANPIGGPFIAAIKVQIPLSVVLTVALRGRKHLFQPIAWVYAVTAFAVMLTAAYYVTTDEFRLVWLVLNLIGVYIGLGRPAGVAFTVLTILCVGTLNRYLPEPFSPNAMATFYVSLVYNSVFFYVYSGRSFSFYLRMVDANAKLKELASRDPLTGLFNARSFYAACDQHIRLSSRNGAPFAVLFIDLDHFKAVNDTWGHEAGDTVLRETAQCLTRETRKSDVVGRIGGEEFCVFLPDTGLKGALLLGESIRIGIESLMPLAGAQRIRVTASIGVAQNHGDQRSISEIQSEADKAMYQAKAAGRNRVTSLGSAAEMTAAG